MEFKEWVEKVKVEQESLIQHIIDEIAERYAPGDYARQNQFFLFIFRACHGALCFKSSDNLQQQRQLDRRFARDSKNAVENIGKVIKFLEKYNDKASSALYCSMVYFYLALKDKKIRLESMDGPADICKLLNSTLSTLKDTWQTDTRMAAQLHRRTHGCFRYPHPIDNDSTAKPHRMLAVYLVALIRLYSSGQSHMMRQPGIPMPETGKPHHDIVDKLVKMVFPKVRISSKSAEADYRKNTPGIRLVSWQSPHEK